MDLLGLLNTGLTAKNRTASAQLEGAGIKRDREQADLLAQIEAQRVAQQDAQRTAMHDLQQKDLLGRIAERAAAANAPKYEIEDGQRIDVTNATATPIQGYQSPAKPTQEEREERGGVAVYENGNFKTWKIRPPTERETSPVAQELNAQRLYTRERGLSDDFRAEQEVKDAKGVAGAVTTIRGALNEGTPQADLAAIYALVKLYDPGSVVREGEIALTQSASSLPQRVRLLWQGWNTGKKLLPEQRQAIQSIADSIVGERQAQINPILQRYGRSAARWGVDSASVAPNPFDGLGGNITTQSGRTFKKVTP